MALRDTLPIVLLAFGILGGIYFGIFTPTEAGGIGSVFALILTAAYRKLTWGVFNRALQSTITITSMFMLIFVGSSILSNSLAALLIPYQMAEWIATTSANPVVVLIVVCLFYLVLGCFMEFIALMVMTIPVIFPVITALGFDPILFGVVIQVLAGISVVTPPVDTNLYVVRAIRGEKGSLGEIIAGVPPFIAAALVLLVLILVFPALTTWLPNQMITR